VQAASRITQAINNIYEFESYDEASYLFGLMLAIDLACLAFTYFYMYFFWERDFSKVSLVLLSQMGLMIFLGVF
jgi:hypothetical protein